MPTKREISEEILNIKNQAQDIVRRKYLKELSDFTNRDTILYCSAYATSKANMASSNSISLVLDDIQGFMSALHGLSNDKLDIIIHSPGGSVEVVEQIVNYLRSKYSHIRAIIPQNAMSAATMLACACDEIILGKHSAIGPIDPQLTFPMQNGKMFTAPAYSLINEFLTAKKEILSNKDVAPLWIPKLVSWPPGILDICNTTIELAKNKVTNWLQKYMFAEEKDALSKAKDIADWLGTYDNHKTHGCPIDYWSMLSKGLKVSLLESNQEFQEKVLSVYHAAIVTIEITMCVKIIENHNGLGVFTQINL